jgi:DUF4097 and DUF4098 domain-containing protein YvlB
MKIFPRTNTLRAPMRDIDNLYIQYKLDDIILLTTEGDELVLEEHLCWDMAKCDTQIAVAGRDMIIRGGARPPSSNTSSLIKLYLPVSYRNNLRISNSVGSVVAEADLESSGQIEIRSTSGSVKLKNICAESIHVDIASGHIALDRITGRSVISAASGMIMIREIHGQSHDIRSASGSVEIEDSYSDNLKMQCASGRITIGKAIGTIEAFCSSGLINVHTTNASGIFTTQSGIITLSIGGTKGTYKLTSNVGNIALSIPRGVPCDLDAKSMMGSIKRSSGEAPELIINARAGVGTVSVTEHEEPPV